MTSNITKKLILVTIFFTPIYLVKITLLGIPSNILELFIYATCLAWLFEKKYIYLNKIFQENRWFFYSSSLIVIGLIISTLANQNYREGLGIIKGWFIDPMLFGIVVMTTMTTIEDVKKILRTFFWSGFAVSLISIAHIIGGQFTYDGRLSTFYLSPNHLAMFLTPMIAIGLFSIFPASKNFLSRLNISTRLTLTALLCITVALYFTQSYAAIISMIASILLAELIKKDCWKNILFITTILLSILILFATFQLPTAKFQDLLNFSERSSLTSRIMIWKSAAKILADHPIVGIGPGNFQAAYLSYQKYFPPYLEWAVPQPHNLYLAFWLESGIIGLVGFIFLLYLWIKKIIPNLQQKNNRQFILATLLAIIFSMLLHGLVDTPYWKNDLAVVFWVVLALGISINYLKD